MNRRKFLAAAVSAGAARAWGKPLGRSLPVYYDPARLIRVGISSRSFRNFFAATRDPSFQLPGPMLSLLDFPAMVAERYEVHRLEIAARHFASTERPYLLEIRRQAYRSRSIILNVQIDLPEVLNAGGLSSPDPGARADAVALAEKWVTYAQEVGAHSVSVLPGRVNPADLSPVIESYRRLAFYGRERGVYTLVGDLSEEDPDSLIAIVRGSESFYVRTLPDFAAFSNSQARQDGLRLLFSRAYDLCHAAGDSFDAQGNESTFDFEACVEISKEARFRGIYSVLYDGMGDPYEGVQNIVNELVRFL